MARARDGSEGVQLKKRHLPPHRNRQGRSPARWGGLWMPLLRSLRFSIGAKGARLNMAVLQPGFCGQFRNGDPDASSNAHYDHDAGVLSSSLNAAHVRPIDLAPVS